MSGVGSIHGITSERVMSLSVAFIFVLIVVFLHLKMSATEQYANTTSCVLLSPFETL
jgi:hypothetical protein